MKQESRGDCWKFFQKLSYHLVVTLTARTWSWTLNVCIIYHVSPSRKQPNFKVRQFDFSIVQRLTNAKIIPQPIPARLILPQVRHHSPWATDCVRTIWRRRFIIFRSNTGKRVAGNQITKLQNRRRTGQRPNNGGRIFHPHPGRQHSSIASAHRDHWGFFQSWHGFFECLDEEIVVGEGLSWSEPGHGGEVEGRPIEGDGLSVVAVLGEDDHGFELGCRFEEESSVVHE